MATPASLKNIRVALIQGSKITEDRTLKRRAPVTVGTDAKNVFVVPVSNLPPSFTLFELVNDQYSLAFKQGMEGRVQVNGADLTLQQCIEQGQAKARGDTYVLPLTDASKGRVTLGEVSLLFQFVTPPPEPPKPELPEGVRGNFLSQLDRMFFSILAGSLLVHFSLAGMIAASEMPPERELTLDELPDRFVKAMMPVEIKKPEKKAEVADAAGDKKKEDKPEKVDKPAETAGKATTNEAHRAEVAKAVSSKGLLKIIGSGGGGDGAFADLIGSSSGVGDIASALNGAGGVGIATADALAAGGPKGGAAGTTAGIGDLATSGGGTVAMAEKTTVQIKGKVADSAPEVESKEVDREALAKYVRGRKAAIQNCYEKELKRNPSLKGKVVVRFTISTAGRATEIDIEENTLGNEAVGACIKTVVRGWVFPFKPPSEVPVAYPFVFSPAS